MKQKNIYVTYISSFKNIEVSSLFCELRKDFKEYNKINLTYIILYTIIKNII